LVPVKSRNVYFGGKLMRSAGVTVVTDRLGSVRANSNGERMRYFPYGDERTSMADGREKFGTYFRDPVRRDAEEEEIKVKTREHGGGIGKVAWCAGPVVRRRWQI
jgi:hypothetical protein